MNFTIIFSAKKAVLVLSALLLLFVSSVDAKPLYDCSNLDNKNSDIVFSQGLDGWIFRDQDLKMDYIPSNETIEYFLKFNQALTKRDIKFIYLPLPPRGLLAQDYLDKTDPMQKYYDSEIAKESYDNFINKIRSAGVLVVDMMEIDEAVDESDVPLSFKRDHHWKDQGSRLSAEAVAELMLENAEKDFGGEDYETTRLGDQDMIGPIAEEMRRRCKSAIPNEEFTLYKTVLKSSSKGEDALFGGSEKSPIAVVGSSYTGNPKFNFEGFLAEYTGHAVANHAIPGGMMFNAIISLVSDPKFQEENPPFLLWEAQAAYDISTGAENNFRQIVPAIYGSCEGEELIKSQIAVKNGKAKTLLKLDQSQAISGENYYIVIDSDNLGFSKFTLEMEYADGDGEWFPVDRTYRFVNRGRFFVGLSDEIDAPMIALKIDGMPEINANLDVRICRMPDSEHEK